MEHRCGRRLPIDVGVILISASGEIGTGRLRDVSATGAFLQTTVDLPLLTLVHVEPIESPGTARDAHRLLAYVVRRGAMGFGIEWTEFAPGIVERLVFLGGKRALLAYPPVATGVDRTAGTSYAG